MNKISTYFREIYKELMEKVTWPTLGTVAAINHDCTGSNTSYYGYCIGNGLCSR